MIFVSLSLSSAVPVWHIYFTKCEALLCTNFVSYCGSLWTLFSQHPWHGKVTQFLHCIVPFLLGQARTSIVRMYCDLTLIVGLVTRKGDNPEGDICCIARNRTLHCLQASENALAFNREKPEDLDGSGESRILRFFSAFFQTFFKCLLSESGTCFLPEQSHNFLLLCISCNFLTDQQIFCLMYCRNLGFSFFPRE